MRAIAHEIRMVVLSEGRSKERREQKSTFSCHSLMFLKLSIMRMAVIVQPLNELSEWNYTMLISIICNRKTSPSGVFRLLMPHTPDVISSSWEPLIPKLDIRSKRHTQILPAFPRRHEEMTPAWCRRRAAPSSFLSRAGDHYRAHGHTMPAVLIGHPRFQAIFLQIRNAHFPDPVHQARDKPSTRFLSYTHCLHLLFSDTALFSLLDAFNIFWARYRNMFYAMSGH